jgi:hypothetical protein
MSEPPLCLVQLQGRGLHILACVFPHATPTNASICRVSTAMPKSIASVSSRWGSLNQSVSNLTNGTARSRCRHSCSPLSISNQYQSPL